MIDLFLYRIFFFCIILWWAQQRQKAHLMLYPCWRNTPTSHNCAIHCNMPEAICQYFARYIRLFFSKYFSQDPNRLHIVYIRSNTVLCIAYLPDKQSALENPGIRSEIGFFACFYLELLKFHNFSLFS